MNPLEAALHYVRCRGWPVFPCNSYKKLPLTPHGFKDATTDERQIRQWWGRWPDALIGMPTGERIGLVVLDIDHKDGRCGFRTLAQLGYPTLPATPTAHTRSGGLHLYFEWPEAGLRNTAGSRGRGIGIGVDWRGDGGYVILPAPGSGYRWGERHFGNCTPLPVPAALMPREPEPRHAAKPIRPASGLSPYADAALDKACRKIMSAPCGEQEATLNTESFSVGTLAGAGAIPADFAQRALLWAAAQIRNYDPRRPWRANEIERKVRRAFDDGMRHPRESRHA